MYFMRFFYSLSGYFFATSHSNTSVQMSGPGVSSVKILKYTNSVLQDQNDLLVREEPLEIRLVYNDGADRKEVSVGLSMRTPGNDFELASGLLFSEGIITHHSEIKQIKYCEKENDNLVKVILSPDIIPDTESNQGLFHSGSACGICGKASFEKIRNKILRRKDEVIIKRIDWEINPDVFLSLNKALNDSQLNFRYTGGIHAAALFSQDAELLLIREDVGRHNALDKLIGATIHSHEINPNDCMLFLSGRAGYELIYKAIMADIRIIISIGAPSSLAVELAQEFGICLVGFMRGNSFNVYSGFGMIEGREIFLAEKEEHNNE